MFNSWQNSWGKLLMRRKGLFWCWFRSLVVVALEFSGRGFRVWWSWLYYTTAWPWREQGRLWWSRVSTVSSREQKRARKERQRVQYTLLGHIPNDPMSFYMPRLLKVPSPSHWTSSFSTSCWRTQVQSHSMPLPLLPEPSLWIMSVPT